MANSVPQMASGGSPQYVEVPGMGVVEFPGWMTDDQMAAAIKSNMAAPSAPAHPVLSRLSDADLNALAAGDLKKVSDSGLAILAGQVAPQPTPQSAQSGSAVGNFLSAAGHHIMKPLHGAAQLVEHGIDSGVGKLAAWIDGPPTLSSLVAGQQPKGLASQLSDYLHRTVASDDKAIADNEAAYQAKTPDSASAYLGATAGEVLPFMASMPARGLKFIGDVAAGGVSKLLPQGSKFIPRAVGGAAQGATVAAVQPVTTPGDYWSNKADQETTGAVLGAAAPTVINGAASLIKPNPSAAYQSLADAGVNTTIGQRLGGIYNSLEEKAQSLPVVGDMIAKARGRALESWNAATLNDVVAPVGGKVTATGHDGVAQAGDILSDAYNSVLSQIKGVKFDQQFSKDFTQLKTLAGSLTPDMAARFDNIVADNFTSRLSPAGGMDAVTLKGVSSQIDALARKYGSATGSEGELGDALKQFGSLINKQIARANPALAPKLDAIDSGWAKLVRVEAAAKSAATNKVNTGVFTPSQLVQAIRASDQSVRDRATARGQALMQDWAQSGLKVLGDKVPNSGTFDRAANGGLLAALLTHPQYAAPAVAGIGAGSLAYTPLAQKLAVGMATKRPASADDLAKALRRYVPLQ